MGNYHYIFHGVEINEAITARKQYIESNLESIQKESEAEYQIQKSFLECGFEHTVLTDCYEVIMNSERRMQEQIFPVFLRRNNRELYNDHRRELKNGNSPLVKYLISPFAIENSELEIVKSKKDNYYRIQNINAAKNTLNTTRFTRNWLQKRIPFFRFEENKFIKEQNNIIKSNLMGMKLNDTKIKLCELHIDSEKNFQQKFELRNHDKLESLKSQYNNFVKQTVDTESYPEAVEKLTNKPQTYKPLVKYPDKNKDNNVINPTRRMIAYSYTTTPSNTSAITNENPPAEPEALPIQQPAPESIPEAPAPIIIQPAPIPQIVPNNEGQ